MNTILKKLVKNFLQKLKDYYQTETMLVYQLLKVMFIEKRFGQ